MCLHDPKVAGRAGGLIRADLLATALRGILGGLGVAPTGSVTGRDSALSHPLELVAPPRPTPSPLDPDPPSLPPTIPHRLELTKNQGLANLPDSHTALSPNCHRVVMICYFRLKSILNKFFLQNFNDNFKSGVFSGGGEGAAQRVAALPADMRFGSADHEAITLALRLLARDHRIDPRNPEGTRYWNHLLCHDMRPHMYKHFPPTLPPPRDLDPQGC